MNRPLRVLSVINELYFGGDENRLLAMARAIDRTRVDLTVVTLKSAEPAVDSHYGTMRGHYAAAGVRVRSLGEGHPNEGLAGNSLLRLLRGGRMFVRTVRAVCKIVRDEHIDLIDAHLGPGNLVGVMAGVLTRTPSVVTTYHVEQWTPHWLWWPLHQFTLASAAAIITDSQDCADRIRRWMVKKSARIVVIPNGVVPPVSERSAEEMRALFGLPNGKTKVVGQISTLLPTKGHMVLIDAARTVIDERPDTAFLIVGYVREDATYRDRLVERARSLGIADRVRIVSYPGSIADVWRAIEVQAHPTMLDSLPNAIIEGMSLGRPAVVTSVGGIPQLVEDGVTGLVVPPNDAGALARALLRILEDDAYGEQLGRAAHERYLHRYTPEHMTSELQDLFADVIA